MAQTTKQTAVPLWRYQCPECGFGDSEMGHMAADHALYCEVCLEDKQPVRLRRWLEEPASSPLAGTRRG